MFYNILSAPSYKYLAFQRSSNPVLVIIIACNYVKIAVVHVTPIHNYLSKLAVEPAIVKEKRHLGLILGRQLAGAVNSCKYEVEGTLHIVWICFLS